MDKQARKEKTVKQTSLILLSLSALSLLLPAVALADDCLTGPTQPSTLRNPLVNGAPSGLPGNAVHAPQGPAVGDGHCAPGVIKGDNGNSAPVVTGYHDRSYGSIFPATSSQGAKVPYGYVPNNGRYQTKNGQRQQGMYDYGQGQIGSTTYEGGRENYGQQTYEAGRELYGQRRNDYGQGMNGQTRYEGGYGNYGQRTYENGGEMNGQTRYESGYGNYGQKSYDYGQGLMGQQTYAGAWGNGGQQTYASSSGIAGQQTYGGGTAGGYGQKSYDYGQGLSGQQTYQGAGGNYGQRTYEQGSEMRGSGTYDYGAGNGGARKMDNGGGNYGQRMYEYGQGNGGTQLKSGRTRGGGEQTYSGTQGNGGTKVGDGGAGNGGGQTTEQGLGNGGTRLNNDGGMRQGGKGTQNEGGAKSNAEQKEDQAFAKQAQGNAYDFQGPLPTVRTFSRYLVILGVVAATVWVGMAGASVIMGHRSGVPRVIGAIAGLLMLLAGYTIWKIVQMNTFHANPTGVWANTRGQAQPRVQNAQVNAPQNFAPPQDPGNTDAAPMASANQVEQRGSQDPQHQRQTQGNMPRMTESPQHYRDTMPNTGRPLQGDHYRPTGPYIGHEMGPDRVGSYDIPGANIVPEPPKSNVNNPNGY